MKVLIVGMGIGQLYKSIRENKLYDVTTIQSKINCGLLGHRTS